MTELQQLDGNKVTPSINASFKKTEKEVGEQKEPLLVKDISISYLAGTINSDEQMHFKKMVFRATRGKVLTHFRVIEEGIK